VQWTQSTPQFTPVYTNYTNTRTQIKAPFSICYAGTTERSR